MSPGPSSEIVPYRAPTAPEPAHDRQAIHDEVDARPDVAPRLAGARSGQASTSQVHPAANDLRRRARVHRLRRCGCRGAWSGCREQAVRKSRLEWKGTRARPPAADPIEAANLVEQ